MLSQFEREVKELTTIDNIEKVKIEIVHKMKGFTTTVGREEGLDEVSESKAESEKQHTWVRTMERFRSALHSVHLTLQEMKIEPLERVKVGLQ